jgi:hypothetical protein
MPGRPPPPPPLTNPIELPTESDWSPNTPERCAWYRDMARSLDDDDLIALYRETAMAQRWHPRDCAAALVRQELHLRGLPWP